MPDTLTEIVNEYERARTIYHKFHSTHEGYAVLAEELDELWDQVKANKGVYGNNNMKKECIQIAAMALRFINDLC